MNSQLRWTWAPYRSLRPSLTRTALAIGLGAAPATAWSAETPKAGRPPGLSVSVKTSKKMCFEDHVEVTGTLVARQLVDVSPEREGLMVNQALVEPLDTVTPGQVLARLAPMEGQGDGTASVSVRSPIAGVIARSWAFTGSPTSTSQPLFQILVDGDLDLQAELPIGELSKLSVGQPVTVRPLGLPELTGKVQALGTALDPASQLGRIRITVSNGHDLRIGTFARGLIVVDRRCGVGVPYSSVMYEPDGKIVDVVIGGRVQARQVTIGLLSGNDVEIRSGLAEAEVVVTRSGPFVRDGEQVNPIDVQDKNTPASDPP